MSYWSNESKLEGESSRASLLGEHKELALLGLIVLVIVGVQRLPITLSVKSDTISQQTPIKESSIAGSPKAVPTDEVMPDIQSARAARQRAREILNRIKD